MWRGFFVLAWLLDDHWAWRSCPPSLKKLLQVWYSIVSLSRMPSWSCMATVWGLCLISPGSLWRLSWVWFWLELASLLALISDISRVTQIVMDYRSLSKQQNNIFFSVEQWYFMSKSTSQLKIKSAITAKGNIIYFYIAGKLFIKIYLHFNLLVSETLQVVSVITSWCYS